jgi:hypothetical protein
MKEHFPPDDQAWFARDDSSASIRFINCRKSPAVAVTGSSRCSAAAYSMVSAIRQSGSAPNVLVVLLMVCA